MPKDDTGDDVLKDGAENSIDDISWDDVSEDTAQGLAESKTGAKDGAVANGAKSSAEFSELKEKGVVSAPKNLDFILDIPLEVTVELGRTSMAIYDLLQLGQGSIVELSKLAGEPLEILVNQKDGIPDFWFFIVYLFHHFRIAKLKAHVYL